MSVELDALDDSDELHCSLVILLGVRNCRDRRLLLFGDLFVSSMQLFVVCFVHFGCDLLL